MSRLAKLGERTFYLPRAVNVGLVRTANGGAILIDTGQDKDYGRAIRKACQAAGLTPIAIINTHSHADHYGGNDYLVRQFSIPVYAPPIEAAIIQNPYLEPMYLFAGGKPIRELTGKWLMGKPSPVDHQLEPGKTVSIAGVEVRIHATPGHSPEHVSIGVDDVLFCADALFGPATLEKYGAPFTHDVRQQIASIEVVRRTNYRVYLPAHGDPVDDADELAEANLAAIEQTLDAVRTAIVSPVDTSTVVRRVITGLGRPPGGIPQFFLFQSLVMAYLSYLVDLGEATARVTDGHLLWGPSAG
jgi:glyoxylase-like metal-dependent hydrolase (beta-lactamase superfamily II)